VPAIIRSLFVLSLCVLVSACVESEAPLSPLATLPPGSPLIGTWVLHDKDETAYLHIGNEGQGVKMVDVELNANGTIKSESYVASATVLGGNGYLSVQTPRNGRLLYTLVKYRLSGNNTLTLWPADYKFLETAVKSGLISGTLDSTVPGVLLTADQVALQRFVVGYGKQMFPKATVTFRRLARGSV
jgi:hypothetical protein